MRADPAPRWVAIRTLILAVSVVAGPTPAEGAGVGAGLVLSRELTPNAAALREIPGRESEDSLLLTPIRELGEFAPAQDSRPEVLALAAIAGFLLANILALFGASLLARSTRERREARAEAFRRQWEPILYGRMAGDAAPLPPLASTQLVMFLNLWLHTLDYVRDDATDRLVALAHELDMPRHVMRLLESRLPFKRLLAMRTAAALRMKEAIVPLQRKAAQGRPRSSLEAASALLRISPEHGFAALKELLAHLEWSPGAIAGMVKTGGEGATQMLAAMLASLPPGGGKQVVRVIELLDDYSAVPILRERLRDNRDDEEIAVILHALSRLGGAPERVTVLAFLAHRNWLVRMQAAAALGVLGLVEDADCLLPLLGDREWWVRYRAAQALFKLGGPEALRRARDKESDRYAIEILGRVLAEC